MRKYHREINICKKILTKNDLLELAYILQGVHKEEDTFSRLFYELNFTDNSNISDDNADIFNNSAIERKRTESVRMEYSNRENSINVRLCHAENKTSFNMISIDSSSEDWLNLMFGKMGDVLSSIKPQSNICVLNEQPLSVIAVFVVTCTLATFSVTAIIGILKSISVEITTSLVQFIVTIVFIMFYLLCDKSCNVLKKFYPNVDFNFGPEHQNISANGKKDMGCAVSAVLIPLILFIAGLIIK